RELVLRPHAALLLPALAEAFDEPFADSSALPTYLVSQLAAQDVKVALSGEGGDELFGGYYTYVADRLAQRFGALAPAARPLVEPLVAGFALALPDRMKVRGLRKKVLLRRAAAPLLPRRIASGPKRGFSIPAAAWLRGELEPFARETLSRETLRRQGFFQPEPVKRLLDQHAAGREDWSRQLWGLLAFTLWYERHVEQEPPRLRSARLEALAAA